MLGDVVEDRYLIEAELGEGAMGRVYRARHVKVGREVAIKVMHRNLARVPAVVERFAREALIAARLRHPNLVSVLDVGTAPDGSPLIVLELAPGEKLASLIDGPQPAERVLALIRQLLRGLEHAHAVGLVHRDLKPDNILVERTEDGREIPRIVDFGIAVACERDDSIAGRRITEANTVIGTPVYMSPEQARAQDVDPRSDLFSLGVIAYELLAGVPPFSGETIEVLLASCTEEPPSMHQRAGVTIEPALEAFVRTLMARRPEDRFQSAREALAALEQLVREPRRPLTPAMAVCGRGEQSPIRDEERLTSDTPTPCDRTMSDTQPGRELATRRLTALPRLATLTPARRRGALAGLAFAVAAVVAVAGWSNASGASGIEVARDVPAIAPSTHSSEPSLEVRRTVHVTVPAAQPDPEMAVEEPPTELQSTAAHRERPVRVVTRAPVVEAAATATASVVTTAPIVTRAPFVTRAPTVTTGPVFIGHDETRSAAWSDEADTPAAVAKRYMEVGKALRGAPDALWQRYRRIRINDALAHSDTRRAALATLAEIENALAN